MHYITVFETWKIFTFHDTNIISDTHEALPRIPCSLVQRIFFCIARDEFESASGLRCLGYFFLSRRSQVRSGKRSGGPIRYIEYFQTSFRSLNKRVVRSEFNGASSNPPILCPIKSACLKMHLGPLCTHLCPNHSWAIDTMGPCSMIRSY